MGWFNDGNPDDYYTLSLWTYKLADASRKQVIHGLIAPRDTTLPQTGWNFKRAARVALLIGADGGVYDSNITGETIAGALGTWQLGVKGQMQLLSPTYVAMTGLDIFTPEYNLPEGQVNLPQDWDLATRKLGAWNYFSAGSDKATCFDVNHHISLETGGVMQVEQDTFNACQPLFYVDKEKSKVFVNNDLEIGQGENANVTITQEGVIKQAGGLTIDADGRIISKDELATNIGDLKQKERYLLDPAHTSVMNDIYLTSRGGVRLSDILPNYILKTQGNVSCANYTTTYGDCGNIAMPTCPTGYQKSLVVMPFLVSKDSTAGNQEATFPAQILHADRTDTVNFSTSNLSVTNLTGDISGDVSGTIPATGGAITNGRLSDGELTNGQFTGGTFTANNAVLSAVPAPNPMSVKIVVSGTNWRIQSKYQSNISVGNQQPVVMQYQTYCVFEPTVYNLQASCESAGFAWDTSSGKCIPGLGEADCKNAGFTWDATNKRCQYSYSLGSINGISDLTKRAATCKAAGKTWNSPTCS